MHDDGSVLAHQFDDLAQQRDASTLGMWAFLATEIMFFGGIFTGYTIYRVTYPAAFAEAANHVSWLIGAINTGVLLCSSLTVAFAVHAAQHGDNRRVVHLLLATIALAAVFLVFKAYEYYAEYQHGLVPGIRWEYDGPHARIVRLYFVFYFSMTAIHALHMVVGIGIFAVVIWMARRNRFSADYYNPVEISGLYWHFVDVVWIFLYPILYLLH